MIMVHDNLAHAAAVCLDRMPKRDPDLIVASIAIAPILHKIANVMQAFGMCQQELKERVLADPECFSAMLDYVFDRFVPEFALEDRGGSYRLIHDPDIGK